MNEIELLSIDLSNYCTKQCPFCYNHSNKVGGTMWKPAEVVSFIKDCVRNGIKAVSLGGGEPFEYDGVFEVIAALQPIVYLSATSNGLPLENNDVWQKLTACHPDKIHITIHDSSNYAEVERVIRRILMLRGIGVKPGVNLLVPSDKLSECTRVYAVLRKELSPEQIILVPQRFSKTPKPQELADVAGGNPFQSPSCLVKCVPPTNFVSVSWDKKVNRCSFAGGKEPLNTLDYKGLTDAIERVRFSCCYK
jgi:organic radical activating enzyme